MSQTTIHIGLVEDEVKLPGPVVQVPLMGFKHFDVTQSPQDFERLRKEYEALPLLPDATA